MEREEKHASSREEESRVVCLLLRRRGRQRTRLSRPFQKKAEGKTLSSSLEEGLPLLSLDEGGRGKGQGYRFLFSEGSTPLFLPALPSNSREDEKEEEGIVCCFLWKERVLLFCPLPLLEEKRREEEGKVHSSLVPSRRRQVQGSLLVSRRRLAPPLSRRGRQREGAGPCPLPSSPSDE